MRRPVWEPLNDTNDSNMVRGSQHTNEWTVAAKNEWHLRSVQISSVRDTDFAADNLFCTVSTFLETPFGSTCRDRQLRDGRWNIGSMSWQKAMKYGFSTMDNGNPQPRIMFSTNNAVFFIWSGLLALYLCDVFCLKNPDTLGCDSTDDTKAHKHK